MIEIGDDLTGEILVRLPVKSLLRFKCVCDRWNDMFKKPTFANRNMKIHYKKKQMLINAIDEPPRMMISENNEVLKLEWQHPFPDDDMKWEYNICGNYNGVFLIHTNFFDKLYLWNPTTGEIKFIILPPYELSKDYFFGFGGDPNTTDFKVLYVVSILESIPRQRYPLPYDNFINDSDDSFNTYDEITYLPPSFELYNLSSNSWTHLDLVLPITFNTPLNEHSICVNGVVYWIYKEAPQHVNKERILCFRFSSNQFTTLDTPLYTDDNFVAILVEINDSLAYVQKYYTTNMTYKTVCIWTLEQDNCWTKKYIFKPLHTLWDIYYVWKDVPEVLGGFGKKYKEQCFVSYNLDGHITHHFEQVTFPFESENNRVNMYVQSIAPLSFC